MGSGLSPNGLPFSDEGIVSLALMDKIKYLDLQRRRVTVEAGTRVEQVEFLPCNYQLHVDGASQHNEGLLTCNWKCHAADG